MRVCVRTCACVCVRACVPPGESESVSWLKSSLERFSGDKFGGWSVIGVSLECHLGDSISEISTLTWPCVIGVWLSFKVMWLSFKVVWLSPMGMQLSFETMWLSSNVLGLSSEFIGLFLDADESVLPSVRPSYTLKNAEISFLGQVLTKARREHKTMPLQIQFRDWYTGRSSRFILRQHTFGSVWRCLLYVIRLSMKLVWHSLQVD